MTISGTVTKILPKKTGPNWTKQEFILTVPGKYPKNVLIEIWGGNIPTPVLNSEITAHIDLESREHQERYYTNVKAWKIEADTKTAPALNSPYQSEDLPFDDVPF